MYHPSLSWSLPELYSLQSLPNLIYQPLLCFECLCYTSMKFPWPFHYACQRLLCTLHYCLLCVPLAHSVTTVTWEPSLQMSKPTGISWFLLLFLSHFVFLCNLSVINLQLCSFINLSVFWSFLCFHLFLPPSLLKLLSEIYFCNNWGKKKTFNPDISCFISHLKLQSEC